MTCHMSSSLSNVKIEKDERHWFGYGRSEYKYFRNQYHRARRRNERFVIEEELDDWYDEDHTNRVDSLVRWIVSIDSNNSWECGNLWVNEDVVHSYKDDMSHEVYQLACNLINSYASNFDDPWYDDRNNPIDDKELAFAQMEAMMQENECEEQVEEYGEESESQNVFSIFGNYDQVRRDAFGNRLTTDQSLTQWHNRKIG